MRLCSIASGSSGNCIYVGSDNTHLLVDTGISKKRIEDGLAEIGLTGEDINGIFITHDNKKSYGIKINLDGTINISDATCIQKFCVSLYDLNDTQKANADVNHDGTSGTVDLFSKTAFSAVGFAQIIVSVLLFVIGFPFLS